MTTGQFTGKHGAHGAVDVFNIHRNTDGILVFQGGRRFLNQGVVQRTFQAVVLRLAMIEGRVFPGLGDV